MPMFLPGDWASQIHCMLKMAIAVLFGPIIFGPLSDPVSSGRCSSDCDTTTHGYGH